MGEVARLLLLFYCLTMGKTELDKVYGWVYHKSEMKKGSIRHRKLQGQKWCFVCQQYRDVSDFYGDQASADGKDSMCKECKPNYYRDYQRDYYFKHKETLLPKHRKTARASYYRRKHQVGFWGRLFDKVLYFLKDY